MTRLRRSNFRLSGRPLGSSRRSREREIQVQTGKPASVEHRVMKLLDCSNLDNRAEVLRRSRISNSESDFRL